MSKNSSELYKKIAGLGDLRHAIKEVKKAQKANIPVPEVAKKAEPEVQQAPQEKPKQVSTPEHGLKYLSRNKMAGGVLTHLIGSGKDGDNHYQVAVNLEKYHKKMPSISISVVSPKGEVLDHSSENHQHMKSAIKSLVNHNMKKAWK